MHIIFHLKTSNDYEIYQLDDVRKEKLDDICDLRQPVVFNYNSSLVEKCSLNMLQNDYHSLDLHIRDITDYDDNSEFFIPLTLSNSLQLLNSDSNSKYITERNFDFIKESGMIKNYKENDNLLKPYGSVTCKYDLLSGSNNSFTPLRYEMNYRNYYLVTQGKVTVKMTPPCNTKYLQIQKDYDNFEFRTEINPWNCQDKYLSEFQKVRFVDIVLTPGMILNIPAYWCYSIKFSNQTFLCNLKYRTLLNNISISPHLFVNMLQKTNIKYTTTKNVKNLSEQINIQQQTENSDKGKDKQENLNSFGQPKSIEELSVEQRENMNNEISLKQTQNKGQINITSQHEQLIRPALESPAAESTSITSLSTDVNEIPSSI